MLQRYKEHFKTIQKEEAEPVLASDWRYRGDRLEPKDTANCSLKLAQKKNNKTCHNALLLNDLTHESIQKLQAIFPSFLEVLTL